MNETEITQNFINDLKNNYQFEKFLDFGAVKTIYKIKNKKDNKFYVLKIELLNILHENECSIEEEIKIKVMEIYKNLPIVKLITCTGIIKKDINKKDILDYLNQNLQLNYNYEKTSKLIIYIDEYGGDTTDYYITVSPIINNLSFPVSHDIFKNILLFFPEQIITYMIDLYY
jgi:hypothetical protein